MKTLKIMAPLAALFFLAVSVQAQTSVTIGSGNQTARIPVDMWWNTSLFQTLLYKFHVDKSYIVIILSPKSKYWRRDATTKRPIVAGSIPESGA
ncbi:MAG: hypothetical protein K0B87_08400, partial [Candidatus Syntrophosphaera sp.]|nr:hypothetical protein [Candidatus Syntrophosphaera sp.]